MNHSLHADAKFSLSDMPRWALIVGGAAVMFIGQLALIFLGLWLLGPPAPHQMPLPNLPVAVQLAVIVVVMPFLETLVGQWLPIRLVTRWFNGTWKWAGAVSGIWFTCLHGYVDRAAVTILLGAAVLATIFVTEARRAGRPVLTTFLTHALANALVQALRLL